MALSLNGSTGISGINGSAGTPALQGGDADTGIFFGTDTASIATAGSERLIVDASGNINVDSGGVYYDAANNLLGIGTTSPSSLLHLTPSVGDGIQIGANGKITRETEGLRITGSSTVNDISFVTAGSEACRIDTSGRLLVGTFSARTNFYYSSVGRTPGIQYEASGSNTALSVLRTDGLAALYLANAGTVSDDVGIGGLNFVGNDGTNLRSFAKIEAEADGAVSTADVPGRLVFSTTADGASSPTERMRITRDGYLKSSYDGNYRNATGTYHEFIGTTANGYTLRAVCDNASPASHYIQELLFSDVAPNNSSARFLQCRDSSAARIDLLSNGGIQNYQANDSNLCDEREKKNIETLDSTWGCLKNWELKKFHYNEDADTDDKLYGVIAQQVAQYCPEVITNWVKQKAEDAVLDEDGNVVTPAVEEVVRMGVKEQQMMWMAIKALQEAQTRIETLEAEVAALKAS